MKIIFITISLLVLPLVYSYGQVGINTENPQGIFHVDGKGDNPKEGSPTGEQQNNDVVVLSDGSVGIGVINPHPSSSLEIMVDQLPDNGKKGFLGPRVSLKSNIDQETIPSPAVGLLVYNMGEHPDFSVNGFLYWAGSEWLKLSSRTSKAAQIADLNCAGAELQPMTYKAGELYNGVLIVPYTGGNGGFYEFGNPISSTGVTGLTAVLQSDDLKYGSGELIYTVTGTPSASSPDEASFEIDFGGVNCSAKVGSNSLRIGQSAYFLGSLPASVRGVRFSEYSTMPSVEDILLFDVEASASSNARGSVSVIPMVTNISDKNVKIWWQGMSSHEGRGDDNVVLAPTASQYLDNGMYLGYGINQINGTSAVAAGAIQNYDNNSERYLFDFIFNDKWYKVEMSFLVDNMDTDTDTDNLRKWYCVITRYY